MRSFFKYGISRRLFLGFAAMFVVLIISIAISNRNANRIIRSENLIIHTHKVLGELANIEINLLNLETGQRGFVITGKPEYLEPYHKSQLSLDEEIKSLKKLVSDNSIQLKRIDQLEILIREKQAELQKTIELRGKISFDASMAFIIQDEGKIIMDKIREKVSQIKEEEIRLLDLRSIQPVKAKQNSHILLCSLLLFGFILSVSIAFFTSRSIVKPINYLIQDTEVIGNGNLDHKLSVNSKDEIGRLSFSFELMMGRLRKTMASKASLEKEIEIRQQTELKLNETLGRLRESEDHLKEGNITKDQLFSIIAHDLRGPFNSLLGISGLLNESFDELEHSKVKKYIESINSGLEDTYALLDNLLLWSRKQRGKISFNPQEENLFVMCSKVIDAIQVMANSKSIEIVKKIPPGITVFADKDLFFVILQNLLSNAIKFTPENGSIKLNARIQFNINEQDYSLIEVIDNGIGIAREYQSKIFALGNDLSTPGTNGEKGTGLGLVLCKDFVSMHKGEIGVESKEGQGSKFFFTIPCT